MHPHLRLHEDERAAAKALLMGFMALHDELIECGMIEPGSVADRLDRLVLPEGEMSVAPMLEGLKANLRARHFADRKPALRLVKDNLET